MSRFYNPEAVWIAAVVVLMIAALVGYIAINRRTDPGYVGQDRWVLCDFCHRAIVYKEPSLDAEMTGQLLSMKHVKLTGKQKNGFVQAEGYGWIQSNMLVEDKPKDENGETYAVVGAPRIPCRAVIGTAPIYYLDRGTVVQVFLKSREWSLTNRGIINTKNLIKRR